jgi:phosphonate transport system substrate-binding protein
MVRRFRQLALLLLTIVLLNETSGGDADSANPLIMGVFPRRGVEQTEALFTPLATYLSEALHRPVRLETSHDFPAFWQKVQEQRYDLVHYNPYHYLRSHKDYGYQVIAQNVEQDQTTIASALVVRKDSGIQSLADLKDKKIVFGGGRTAMLSYMGPTLLLREAGLSSGDYFEQFALTPEKACVAVYYRQAAAAGSGSIVLTQLSLTHAINVEELQILKLGKPLAHLPWAIKQELPPGLSARIAHVLQNLHTAAAGQRVLEQAQLTRLQPASDAEYNPYRRIVQLVTGEKL